MPNQYTTRYWTQPVKRPIIIPIGPSIAYVPLTQGQFAVIAVDDVPKVEGRNWSAWWNAHSRCYWAVSSGKVDGKRTAFRMHSVVAGTQGTRMTADHVEPGTGLNCLPHNIRAATYSQQNMNTRRRKDNTSGYKGVSPPQGRWRARIAINGKAKLIGVFATREEAHEAYKAHALLWLGSLPVSRC